MWLSVWESDFDITLKLSFYVGHIVLAFLKVSYQINSRVLLIMAFRVSWQNVH